jgi:plastocyanin
MGESPSPSAPENGRPVDHRPALLARVIVLAGALLMIAAAVGVALVLVNDDAGEYRVVIPAGTGLRIDAGEPVELIPANLHLDVGTTFIVQNEDDRTHEVGPFSVRAGEVLTYRFDRAAVYQGTCTVHPAGQVTITVS